MNNSSKSSLFLIELILSIFFFIIAMAVCLQLFVKAHTLSNDTISMNHAVLWTQNLAEIFLGNNGNYDEVKATYSGSDCISSTGLNQKTNLLLLFDKNWEVVTQTDSARYIVLSSYSSDDDYAYEDIYVASYRLLPDIIDQTMDNDKLIHHIQVKKYIHRS